ncbi:MFS transporter [Pseudoclavibacter endophyticus]|nr:MFS transporter [Pseudoclavibacter endophyticus]
MFRSLAEWNYRVWFAGSLASNIGTWMQRTAQSWIVLTELTDHDATALGIVTGLQFAPQLVFAPFAGVLADRMPKRRLLAMTQLTMGALALALGLIVTLGLAELWHVMAFALLLGVAASFDAPARQAFVSELVEPGNLSNAVALNSTSFNGARLIGPALAGVLTVVIGSGPVFLLNALTFAATLWALAAMRASELRSPPLVPRGRGQLRAGLRYVAGRPDIVAVMVAIFLLSTFGMNFPVFTATMATIEFGQDADGFGLLNSVIAVGSLGGALLAARRDRPRFRIFIASLAFFGLACGLAAVAPSFWLFALALIPVGFTALSSMTTANALVQGSTDPSMRGRVMALYMAILLGGTPVGAPLMGWLVELIGPRGALAIGGASGVVAAFVAVWLLRNAGVVRWRDFPWLRRDDPPSDR